jgi:serine/threonine protein kinase
VNNDRLLIADFGLSNSMGNRTGNVGYIDPQCFKDHKYVRREKSDIYSLGVLLWEITSGRPLFHNDNVFKDDIEQNNLQNYTGYTNLRDKPIEGIPLEYRQLYEKCLDDNPEKRPDINKVYDEILSQSDELCEEVNYIIQKKIFLEFLKILLHLIIRNGSKRK